MNQNVQPHSGAWVTFTYVSFSASAFMVAIGVYFLPLDLWIKGYLSMGIVMLIQSCVTLTKTIRDMHESGKLVNRIEDAKAERLLMEVAKAAYPVPRWWRRRAAGVSSIRRLFPRGASAFGEKFKWS